MKNLRIVSLDLDLGQNEGTSFVVNLRWISVPSKGSL